MTLAHRTDSKPKIVPADPLGHCTIGDVSVMLYVGLEYTVRQAERGLQHGEVVRAYRTISDDQRNAVNFYLAKKAVLGHVQERWYEARGIAIPAKVIAAQETRMAKAAKAAPEAEGGETAVATKEPRITTRSIIETGLLNGTSEEDILAEVKEHFPNGKADSKHVAYYRHFLIKAGKMEKPVKAPKEPKPKKGAQTSEAAMKEAAAAQEAAPKAAAAKKATAAAGGKKARA